MIRVLCICFATALATEFRVDQHPSKFLRVESTQEYTGAVPKLISEEYSLTGIVAFMTTPIGVNFAAITADIDGLSL